jgi:phytanoyl-CoA hydroxylase
LHFFTCSRSKSLAIERLDPDIQGGVNKAYHGIMNYDKNMPLLHVEMEPGDTIFFHPILIHGSGANRTSGQ